MDIYTLTLLILVFLITSVVGVVTGSNSLIAVPAMFQAGIEPKIAVATNMFGLVFMSVGGTIPFLRKKQIDIPKISPLIAVTIVGSALGALLVGVLSGPNIKLIVSTAMIFVAVFSLLRRNVGVSDQTRELKHALPLVYLVT